MKIAFYLDNSCTVEVDFSKVLFENPGCGGTEFEFYKIGALLAKQKGLEPILLLRHQVNPLYCPIVHHPCRNEQEAYEWASANECDFLVFRGLSSPKKDKLKKPKILCWMHNGESAKTLKFFVHENDPDGIIFVSKSQYLLHSRFIRQKAFLCHNALSGGIQNERLFLRQKIAYIGGPTFNGNFDKVLLVFSEILKTNHSAHLKVFGIDREAIFDDDTEWAMLCQKIISERSIPLNSIELMGRVPSSVIDDEMRDVLIGIVNPGGAKETFCISATDFLRNAVPPIVPCAGPFFEVVPRHCGYRILCFSSIRSIFSKAIKKPHRPQQKGLAGQHFVLSFFSDEQVIGEWLDLFYGKQRYKRNYIFCLLFGIYNYMHLVLRRLFNRRYNLREY